MRPYYVWAGSCISVPGPERGHGSPARGWLDPSAESDWNPWSILQAEGTRDGLMVVYISIYVGASRKCVYVLTCVRCVVFWFWFFLKKKSWHDFRYIAPLWKIRYFLHLDPIVLWHEFVWDTPVHRHMLVVAVLTHSLGWTMHAAQLLQGGRGGLGAVWLLRRVGRNVKVANAKVLKWCIYLISLQFETSIPWLLAIDFVFRFN